MLIRALRDSNLPKFLAFDIPLFFAIIADLFPGVTVPDNDYGEFQTVMCEEILKAGLQNVPGFHSKVIQMFDILNIRFGATLVGPTGAGKSTCYRILAATMSSLFRSGFRRCWRSSVEFHSGAVMVTRFTQVRRTRYFKRSSLKFLIPSASPWGNYMAR